ncbi:unnamed protein product [Spirodela intermedia]|uniref:Fatty acid desaturase domain-containing protein n=1 Tax=Spirodela intermedia TaxID=51605 RepID=A0A7I8LDI3_SPIIN|nr:unnamed protein product [Spirodela intermedia]
MTNQMGGNSSPLPKYFAVIVNMLTTRYVETCHTIWCIIVITSPVYRLIWASERAVDLVLISCVLPKRSTKDGTIELLYRQGEYQLKWGGHLWQRAFQRHRFHHNLRKNSMVIQAVAAPVSAPVVGNDEERKQMCENYGFTQIAELVPDDITLRDIISSLPKKVLQEDTAWHPVRREEFDSQPLLRKGIILGYGPFRPWMSIAHWLVWHFDVKKFRPNEVQRVKISLACVSAFIAIGWPLIIFKTGFIGWIKYWFMPFLVYHFWMSTFTMVHHTAPHIPFKASDVWNAAQAQLSGTVHCTYPRWVEILCHDINVHIPHHISPRIPSYNLRDAHKSLQENWGKYLNEANWNWRLMKTIMTVCHVYNEEHNYVPFDSLRPEESGPILFLKKVMPDYA